MPRYEKVGPRGRTEVMQAVIEATIELLANRNYSDVSIKQICEQAGVNPGLVYLYFGSKEDVVREAVAGTFSRLTNVLESTMDSEDGVHSLARIFDLERKYVNFLITAALAPFTRSLGIDVRLLNHRIAKELSRLGGTNPAGLDSVEKALGLLALGLGFSVLERTRDASFPGSTDLLADMYPRWIHFITRPGDMSN